MLFLQAVLPFPDSAELSAANAASKVSNSIANKSETEKALSEIWANRLQHHTIAEVGHCILKTSLTTHY